MKRTLMLVCMIMIVYLQYGVVLFNDDFNRTEGSAVGNSWTNIGPVSPIIENSSMKVVSNSLQGVRRDFTSLGITSGIYYVSYDWKITSNNWLADAFPNGTVTYLRHDYEGNLYYDNTSDFSNPITIGSLATDTWANFKLKVNIDTDRFSLWVNNNLVADNIAGLAVTDFTRFTFRAGTGSTVTQYIDNFIVYNDTPPVTPTNLTAMGAVNDISLSWTGSPQDFLTYKIYRKTTSPADVFLAEVPGTQTTYTDFTAVANTDYFYRVKAVSMNTIESGFSNEVTAHLQPDIVVTPQVINVTVGQGYTGTAEFTIANNGNYQLNYSISSIDNGLLPSISGFTAMGIFNGHSYYRSSSTMTWTAAKTLCEQHGGYLATISSAGENNFVYQNTIGTSWIGLNDEVTEGTFRWSNGEPITYTNWYSGQPDNSSNEDYAHIRFTTFGAQWNDHQNTYLSYAVLEFGHIYGLPSYIAASPVSGILASFQQSQVELNLNAQNLTANVFTDTLYVISNDNDTPSIPVIINFTVAPGDIAVEPTEITVKLNTTGNTVNTSLDITNTGIGKLDYTISGTDSYSPSLTIPPISGFSAIGIFNGHRYYKSNSSMSWSSAKSLCEGNGGHLVTITSAAENSFCSSPTRMWIGLTDQISEGTYMWVTGEPLLYTNWAPSQPDNAGGLEDFVEINWNNSGWWNDSTDSGWNGNVQCILEIDNAVTYVSMLDFYPSSGILETSSIQTTSISINGSSLSDGLYQTSARIVSNAPEPRDTLYIPVTVKVDYNPPTAPLGLTFDEVQSDMNQIYLSWTANALADSVYSYKVFRRGLHDTLWSLKGTVDADHNWFIDNQFTGLDTTAVYYKITAIDWVDNESAASEEVMAWLQRFPAPTGLTMEIIRDRHVQLTWNPVTQTISGNPGTPSCYVIYRSNTPSPIEDFYFVGAVDATTFTHNWAAWFIEIGKQFYLVTAYSGSFEDLRAVADSRRGWKYGELESALQEKSIEQLKPILLNH